MEGLRSEDYSAPDPVQNSVSIQSIERRILEQRIKSVEPSKLQTMLVSVMFRPKNMNNKVNDESFDS